MNNLLFGKLELWQSRTIPLICLVSILLAHTLHFMVNYEIKMVNDEWEYLTATRSLLDGHFIIKYPPYDIMRERFGHSAINTFDAMFHQKNSSGDLVPIVSIGIILLLAPFYKLFGNHIFYILPLLLDCIALVSMFLIGSFFQGQTRTRNQPWFFGLLYTVSYAVIVNFRPGLRRDLLCASIMVPLTLLILQGIQKNRRLFWYMAYSIISFLSIIKPTYVLLYVPLVLSCAAVNRFNLRALRPRDILVILVLSLIVFTPYFVHNHFITGSFLIPKQIGSAKTFIPRGNPILYFLENAAIIVKAQAGIFSPSNLNSIWAIPIVIMIAAGFVMQRKNPFVRYWVTPTIGLFYLFHLFTRRHDFIYNIYLAPTYSLSLFLCTAGIAGTIALFKHRNTLLLIICFFLTGTFVFAKWYKTLPGKQPAYFQLTDANILKQKVDSTVPPGSLIICDRFLCYVIDFFTSAYSVSPWMLSDDKGGLEAKINFLIDHGIPVYFCTYQGIENAPTYLAVLRNSFRLEECEPFKNHALNLGAYKGEKQLTLYSIAGAVHETSDKTFRDTDSRGSR